jgi:hypothetical protein
VNTCACSGYRLMFCTHSRHCRLCGALTTGLRPPELKVCGGCNLKLMRAAFADDTPLVPHLRAEILERAGEALHAAVLV